MPSDDHLHLLAPSAPSARGYPHGDGPSSLASDLDQLLALEPTHRERLVLRRSEEQPYVSLESPAPTEAGRDEIARRRAVRRAAESCHAEARRRRRTRLPGALALLLGLAITVLWAATAAAGHHARRGGAQGSAATTALAPAAGVAPHVAGPGRVSQVDLNEPTTHTTHTVWIYRPAVADSRLLPVLYFLHGLPGDASEIFRHGLAASLDRLFSSGAAPFVVVAPNGHTAHPDPEWVDAADGSQRLESFLISTVIPVVEGAEPRDRAHRAIAGFSMGGYGAANIALHHPDLFGQLVSIAGYFHAEDPDGVLGTSRALRAYNSPDQQLARARGLHILLLDGAQDDVPGVQGQTQRFAALLGRAHVAHTVSVAPGSHDLNYVAGQLPALESFLETGWSAGLRQRALPTPGGRRAG